MHLVIVTRRFSSVPYASYDVIVPGICKWPQRRGENTLWQWLVINIYILIMRHGLTSFWDGMMALFC